MEVSRYPLSWPAHQPRTPAHKRDYGRFDDKRSRNTAIEELQEEVRRLKGRNMILSSNLKLRNDLLPYSNQPKTDDPGVAVYFDLDGESTCIACDRFLKDVDNIWAIKKTIECLRGVERYGSTQMMKQAFTGFAALPAPTAVEPWWVVLEVDRDCSTYDEVLHMYRLKVREVHPDIPGGSVEEFNRVQAAWDSAKEVLDMRVAA